jgi:hypothetical protein
MHTCYSLYTNKVLNLVFSNLNHATRFLHSLALQRCFSVEQMSKRPPMDEWNKYLYALIQNITVGGQLSKFRGDWTHLSGWPDAPVSSKRRCVRINRWYWPDSVLHPVNTHRTRPVSKFPLWMLSDVDRTLAPQHPIQRPVTIWHLCRWNELTGLSHLHPVTTRPTSGQSFDPPFIYNSKSFVNEVDFNWSLGYSWAT